MRILPEKRKLSLTFSKVTRLVRGRAGLDPSAPDSSVGTFVISFLLKDRYKTWCDGRLKKSEVVLRREILEQEGKAWRRQLLFFEFGMQRMLVWQSPQTVFSSSGFLNSQVTGSAWEFQGCCVSKQRELATVLSERVSIFKWFLNLATSFSGK